MTSSESQPASPAGVPKHLEHVDPILEDMLKAGLKQAIANNILTGTAGSLIHLEQTKEKAERCTIQSIDRNSALIKNCFDTYGRHLPTKKQMRDALELIDFKLKGRVSNLIEKRARFVYFEYEASKLHFLLDYALRQAVKEGHSKSAIMHELRSDYRDSLSSPAKPSKVSATATVAPPVLQMPVSDASSDASASSSDSSDKISEDEDDDDKEDDEREVVDLESDSESHDAVDDDDDDHNTSEAEDSDTIVSVISSDDDAELSKPKYTASEFKGPGLPAYTSDVGQFHHIMPDTERAKKERQSVAMTGRMAKRQAQSVGTTAPKKSKAAVSTMASSSSTQLMPVDNSSSAPEPMPIDNSSAPEPMPIDNSSSAACRGKYNFHSKDFCALKKSERGYDFVQVKNKITGKVVLQLTSKQFGGLDKACLAARVMVRQLQSGKSIEYCKALKAQYVGRDHSE